MVEPEKITRYLVHLGHWHVCVISRITSGSDLSTKRLEGIQSELSQHGMDFSDKVFEERPHSISGGRKTSALFLFRNDPWSTAILCWNDILAMDALIECNALRMDVPKDFPVVGFDDPVLSMHSNPSLTTIDVPAEEMGPVRPTDFGETQ